MSCDEAYSKIRFYDLHPLVTKYLQGVDDVIQSLFVGGHGVELDLFLELPC